MGKNKDIHGCEYQSTAMEIITFSKIVKKLLFEITARTYSTDVDINVSDSSEFQNDEDKNISFLDFLDSLLRKIAVLDPLKFSDLVRVATDEYLKKIDETDASISETVDENMNRNINENENETNDDKNNNYDENKIVHQKSSKQEINPTVGEVLSGLLEHGEMLLNFMK